MQLSEQQLAMVKSIAQQHPDFSGMLDAWKSRELEVMYQGTQENFGVQKGRVQLLTELQQKFRL